MNGLIYLGTLAKLLKVDCRKLRRLIQQLEQKHATQLITKPTERAHYLVDLTRLHSIEPAIFAHVTLRSIEADELHSMIIALEKRVEILES